MRIIAGAARGRRIASPPGPDTRPTADRVREALFSAVESRRGPLTGARVLDLFAGSGALGLEALSRGAAHVLLVESDPRAVRTIRANVEVVRRPGAEVRQADVARVLAGSPPSPYDLVLADPPYDLPGEEVTALLSRLRDGGWATPETLVVVERSRRAEPLRWPEGSSTEEPRHYGETCLWYGHLAG